MMALAAFELEGHFFWAAELIDNLGGHGRALNQRRSHRGRRAVVDEENLSKTDLPVHFHVELFDIKLVAFLDTVLFAAGLEYCVGQGG